MKNVFVAALLLLIVAGAYLYPTEHTKAFGGIFPRNLPKPETAETKKSYHPPANQTSNIKAAVKERQLHTGIAFLIDMKLPAAQNRFFIYDLKKDSIIAAGAVTHGRCGENWLEGRRYSNEVGSGCTSLGNYKVGIPYYGRFGRAYKLHGLDSSNSNAFKRYVVLHSHSCVPETEVDYEICQSDGCPTVSPGFLKLLEKTIDTTAQPILLSIYESDE